MDVQCKYCTITYKIHVGQEVILETNDIMENEDDDTEDAFFVCDACYEELKKGACSW